ncbi:MAG: suppressor of fused domain protein [Burkholderiales bacterium]|jgi:hypothetical protein|nr:suppressor of fused domain protein [Burkholderiales bacterium]
MTTKNTFAFDVWRSVVLAHLIRHWGMPKYRSSSKLKTSETPIEIYTFSDVDGITKFATIGLSCQKRGSTYFGKELILVLPTHEVATTAKRTAVVNYLMRIAVHYMKHAHKNSFFLIPPSDRAPESWVAKGILIDAPRGEPRGFERLEMAKTEIFFKWVAPLTAQEYSIITREGNDVFFKWINKHKIGLIDVTPTRKVVRRAGSA